MTKTKYDRQTSHSRPWCVRLTPEIMAYLSAPTKYGASRLSAYLDLLRSVAETTTPYKPLYGRTFNLETGQLVISITELADRWNWARETVRKFFDQMESFGLLSKSQLDRCSLVTMTMEWTDAGYTPAFMMPSVPFVVPDVLADKMDAWLDGDIADSEFVETIEEAIADFDNTDVNLSPNTISILLYSQIRQMVRKWQTSGADLPETPDTYSIECLGRIFTVCLSGNWSHWLPLLKGYSPGINPESGITAIAKKPSAIADARAVLDGLFIHLKVDFTSNNR